MKPLSVNPEEGFFPHLVLPFLSAYGASSAFVLATADMFTDRLKRMLERTGRLEPQSKVAYHATPEAVEALQLLLGSLGAEGQKQTRAALLHEATGVEAPALGALIAILDSSVVRFFFPQICPKVRGDFMRFKSIHVGQIPIPPVADPKPVETLVDRILSAKSVNPDADVSPLEREIDQLVYRLYGLTAEEMAVVEEGSG